MRGLLYILIVALANVVTAKFAPAHILGLLIPWGSYFIGLTFVLRDLAQNKYGRKMTYYLIGTALIVSAITSHFLGDSIMITLASALTFCVSETLDSEFYTRLKRPMSSRVWYSGLISGVADSAIFVVIGLSPLGAGFIPWVAVPLAIIGQLIIKTLVVGISSMTFKALKNKNPSPGSFFFFIVNILPFLRHVTK